MNKANDIRRLDAVPHGSTILFEHEGKILKGINYRDSDDELRICEISSNPSQTLVLAPDTEVEVIRLGGIKVEVTEVPFSH